MNNIDIESMIPDDEIMLDGLVEYCYPEGEDRTIGVKSYKNIKTFRGNIVEELVGEFPFTKNMADKCGWGKKFARVQMLTSKTPIDLEHIDETKIISMMGEVESKYYAVYSELTGYLWTEEEFKCGGHDLRQILESHLGEYIHMEIELYQE